MGMHKTISRITLLAALAMAGFAYLPFDIAKAAGDDAVSVSTRLFLGRVNNWMIWEFEGNEGRFCFLTSSPEGTSPLRQTLAELWVTKRPIFSEDGEKEHVFEFSLTAEAIEGQAGPATLRMVVDKQKHDMTFIEERFWLRAKAEVVEKLLEVMLELDADYQEQKKHDPRSEPDVPIIDVKTKRGNPVIAAHFSVIGFAKAKAAIDDHCP
jgi:hypothetical protein